MRVYQVDLLKKPKLLEVMDGDLGGAVGEKDPDWFFEPRLGFGICKPSDWRFVPPSVVAGGASEESRWG